jgi:hypothetical protein
VSRGPIDRNVTPFRVVKPCSGRSFLSIVSGCASGRLPGRSSGDGAVRGVAVAGAEIGRHVRWRGQSRRDRPEEDAMIPEAQKQAGRLAGLAAVLRFAVAAGLGVTS